jgi:hypothetical protein
LSSFLSNSAFFPSTSFFTSNWCFFRVSPAPRGRMPEQEGDRARQHEAGHEQSQLSCTREHDGPPFMHLALGIGKAVGRLPRHICTRGHDTPPAQSAILSEPSSHCKEKPRSHSKHIPPVLRGLPQARLAGCPATEFMESQFFGRILEVGYGVQVTQKQSEQEPDSASRNSLLFPLLSQPVVAI